MKSKIYKKIIYWLPPIIWALLIFKFSSGSVPKASQVYWQDFAVKKIAHIIFFGILALLLYRALLSEKINKKKSAIWSVIVTTLYGASDEYHQNFTQGRESKLRDVFFDGLGASIFMFIIYGFLQKLPKKVQSLLAQIGIK